MSYHRQCYVTNQQTDELKLPMQASQKEAIEIRLDQRGIEYETSQTKVELLEIVVKFAPPRQYKVDDAAQQFDVEILCLPVRHTILSPIELAWARLKNYIRDDDATLQLVDIHNLAIEEYVAAVDEPLATICFRKHQKI